MRLLRSSVFFLNDIRLSSLETKAFWLFYDLVFTIHCQVEKKCENRSSFAQQSKKYKKRNFLKKLELP